jgi:hypothetical protein
MRVAALTLLGAACPQALPSLEEHPHHCLAAEQPVKHGLSLHYLHDKAGIAEFQKSVLGHHSHSIPAGTIQVAFFNNQRFKAFNYISSIKT